MSIYWKHFIKFGFLVIFCSLFIGFSSHFANAGVADLIDSGNFGFSSQPGAEGEDTDIFDVTGAAIRNTINNHHLFSPSNLKDEALQYQRQMIESITGKDLYDVIGEDARENEIETYRRIENLLHEKPEIYADVPNAKQALENATEKARLSQKEFENVLSRANSFEQVIGSFVGGTSGATLDLSVFIPALLLGFLFLGNNREKIISLSALLFISVISSLVISKGNDFFAGLVVMRGFAMLTICYCLVCFVKTKRRLFPNSKVDA